MMTLSLGGVCLKPLCPTDWIDRAMVHEACSNRKNSSCLVSGAFGSLKPLKMEWCAFLRDKRETVRKVANLKSLSFFASIPITRVAGSV